MNNNITLSLLGGALLTGSAFAGSVAGPTSHAAPSFESDLTVGYDSQYMFRGLNSGDDLVSTALNTAWTCEHTGLDFNAGAWYGSYDFPRFDALNIDELDLYAGVSKDLGIARFNTGFIHRDLLDFGGAYAQEVYFGLSKDLAYGISSSLTYFWDVNGGDFLNDGDNDGYTELALDKSCDLLGHKLDAGLALGYLAEEGELSHLTAKLAHDIALSQSATLTPYIAHTWELDGLENGPSISSGPNQENEFFAGAALNVSF